MVRYTRLSASAALADLAARRINVVFSVDLFNEGIDVPAVDTLLMLRPTDSPTLFLQQLGRGLRRSVGKSVCIVLDFVGHHRKEFRLDRRFRALLGGTRKELAAQVEAGFPFLPAGCHMELDRVATDVVLESIRNAVPSRWTERVDALRQLTKEGVGCTLARYLDETGLELDDVYAGNKSWSDLRADADIAPKAIDPIDVKLRRACGRLLHIDDMLRISVYRRFLESDRPPDVAQFDPREQRLVRMLVSSVVAGAVTKDASLQEGTLLLWSYQHIRGELFDLLEVLAAKIQHVPLALSTHSDVPLEIHAQYTRSEILAAFGIGERAKVAPWQTGVYWAVNARADLLAFTLDKTTGQFSPTTRYRDYAISPDLIHWESQSVTRADSETGIRYQKHATMGSSVMLFARRRSDERAFYFLGPATYEKHESELPMAITWRLTHPLPGDLFAAFAAAVA